MNSKWDYDALERQYVMGQMSLRELAASVGMKNHSLIMAQSKRREWTRKRDEFRDRKESKAAALMADDAGRRLAREAEVRDNAIDAIDEMISRLRADLHRTHKVTVGDTVVEEPVLLIKPTDIAVLIDKLQVLFGRPSHISEERSLGLSITDGDPDLLRRLVEATRGIPTDARAVGGAPFPRLAEPGAD